MRAIFLFRALLSHVTLNNATWRIRKSEKVWHWSHWTRWNDVTWPRSGCQEAIHGNPLFFWRKVILLDGPDNWRSYIQKSEFIYHPRHQKNDGGNMVWSMVLPNGLLFYKILCRDFKSPTYIDLLCDTIVPICKLNYGNNFWFQ